MIYFDTDVLTHFLVPQDKAKHQLANTLYKEATDSSQFFISLLCLQETAFVLHKLGQTVDDIDAMLSTFMPFQPCYYTIEEFNRGALLARKIGFQNINDCIHTAVAESHCNQFYTFNKADFKKIRRNTDLNINLL